MKTSNENLWWNLEGNQGQSGQVGKQCVLGKSEKLGKQYIYESLVSEIANIGLKRDYHS